MLLITVNNTMMMVSQFHSDRTSPTNIANEHMQLNNMVLQDTSFCKNPGRHKRRPKNEVARDRHDVVKRADFCCLTSMRPGFVPETQNVTDDQHGVISGKSVHVSDTMPLVAPVYQNL